MKINQASPYASSVRSEVHALIPAGATRFLDVGCNDGRFGQWLRSSRDVALVGGIEPHPVQASVARQRLDFVVEASYPQALEHVEGRFDCITFNHVIEHIVDPWAALKATRRILEPDGVIVALIPNVRYLSLIFDLLFRGKWTYQETGLLDRTHVRFFTRRSAEEMFREAGYRVEIALPVNAMGSVRFPRSAKVISRALGELTYGGFAFLARQRE